MATVQQTVEDLAQGRRSLPEVVRDFATRPWPERKEPTLGQLYGVEDQGPPSPNSPDWIEIEPDLTDEQREALRGAYDRAQ